MFLRGHKEAIKDFRLLENSKLLSWSFDGTVKVNKRPCIDKSHKIHFTVSSNIWYFLHFVLTHILLK